MLPEVRSTEEYLFQVTPLEVIFLIKLGKLSYLKPVSHMRSFPVLVSLPVSYLCLPCSSCRKSCSLLQLQKTHLAWES